MILKISDGTTTIVLDDPITTGIYRIVQYIPQTPTLRSVSTPNLGDGSQVDHVEYENVAETCSITLNSENLTGASTATVIALVRSINLLFERARAGVAVWVEYSSDDLTIWKSPISMGRATLDEDSHKLWQLAAGNLDLSLEWTRAYYWEGGETLATVTGAGGTGTAVTLYGRDDGTSGQGHWITIASSQIGGDLPARVRLVLQNSYNNVNGTGNVFVGRSAYAATSGQRLVLEGELATGSGSTVADSLSSNGTVRRTATMGSVLGIYATWTLDSTYLQALAGRNYKIMLRVGGTLPAAIPAGTWAAIRVSINGTTPLLQTQPILLSSSHQLQEVATIPLAPVSLGSVPRPLTLELMLFNTNATGTLDIDCLYLLPTESYRALWNRGYPTAYGAYTSDDNGIVYSHGYSPDASARIPNYVGDGSTLTLTPGVTNTIYVLAESSTGVHTLARTTQASVYVSPRRLTI